MRKLLIFSFIIAVGWSCNKSNYTGPDSIKAGRVIDGNSGKPLRGVWVYLLERNNDAVGAWGMKTINSHQTNEDGYFDFDYNREDNNSYYIVVESEPLYGRTDYILIKHDDRDRVVKMYGTGWIKYHVINEPPLDTLKFLLINGTVVSFDGLYGFSRDTMINGIAEIGNRKSQVNYWIQKYGEEEIYVHDSIYVSAFDTATYTIKY